MISKLQFVARLTKDIVETYRICNPQFTYSEELNPKRFLTSPSAGVLNDGHDNANSDLILSVNLELVNLDTKRRLVLSSLSPNFLSCILGPNCPLQGLICKSFREEGFFVIFPLQKSPVRTTRNILLVVVSLWQLNTSLLHALCIFWSSALYSCDTALPLQA